jgi:hypothetical protein
MLWTTPGAPISSGVSKSRARRSRRPALTRLKYTDSGTDNMSGPATGSSHHEKDGSIQAITANQAAAAIVAKA